MSHQDRLACLQATLTSTLDKAYWIEDPISLKYMTGLDFSTGILLVSRQDAALLVDGRYQEMARTEQSLYPVFSSEPVSLAAVLKSAPFSPIRSFALSDQSPYSRFTAIKEVLRAAEKTLVPL